jgi:hypothetical protein
MVPPFGRISRLVNKLDVIRAHFVSGSSTASLRPLRRIQTGIHQRPFQSHSFLQQDLQSGRIFPAQSLNFPLHLF